MLSDEIKLWDSGYIIDMNAGTFAEGFSHACYKILPEVEAQEKLMKEMYNYITFYYQNIYVEDDGEYWDNAENIIKQYESICKEL